VYANFTLRALFSNDYGETWWMGVERVEKFLKDEFKVIFLILIFKSSKVAS
jgi:hypothetical protein